MGARQALGVVVFHHEISRSRAEQPPVPEPAEGPIRRRVAPSARPADLIPWALLVVLAMAAMSALGDMNLHDQACWPPEEGWNHISYESTRWPPGRRCDVTMDDGTVVVDNPGWGMVYASGAGLALVAAGFLHPKESAWRRMALALLVPGTLVTLIALSLLTGFRFYVGAIVLAFALVPALVTWAVTNVLTTWPRGRTFVGSWLGWGLAIGTGAVIAGVT